MHCPVSRWTWIFAAHDAIANTKIKRCRQYCRANRGIDPRRTCDTRASAREAPAAAINTSSWCRTPAHPLDVVMSRIVAHRLGCWRGRQTARLDACAQSLRESIENLPTDTDRNRRTVAGPDRNIVPTTRLPLLSVRSGRLLRRTCAHLWPVANSSRSGSQATSRSRRQNGISVQAEAPCAVNDGSASGRRGRADQTKGGRPVRPSDALFSRCD